MPRSLLGPWRRLKVGALLLLLSSPAGLRLGELLVGRAGAQGNKDKDTNRDRPLAPPGTPVAAKARGNGSPLGKDGGKDSDVARDVSRDLMRELRKGQGKAPAGDEAPAVPPLRFEGPLAPAQTALRAGQYADAAQRAQKLAETSKDAIVRDEAAALDVTEGEETGETLLQKVQKMGITDKLKAAMRGSREMRALLIRDPNKMIGVAVLSSPKVSEAEIESFAKMATIPEDILRVIATNRAWLKNYSVVLALTKNPKTPVGLSLNMLNRLNDRDLAAVSTDRNVPDPLRVAARRKIIIGEKR